MTTGDEVGSVERTVSYLRDMVPTLPLTLGSTSQELLLDFIPHGDLQAVIMAAMNLVPHLDRSAFTDSTTIGDLAAWLGPALVQERVEAGDGLVARPRGSYATGSATLRPVGDRDVEDAYRSSLNPRIAHRWRFRGHTPSPEEFRRLFFTPTTLAQFAVVPVERPADAAVGIVSAYDADLSSGHCAVAFLKFGSNTDESNRGDESKGLMIEGLFVMVQYLFDHYSLIKVYAEIPEYNVSLFAQGLGGLFVKEGELRQHFYYGDRYWSQFVFALYRDRWDELAEAFRGKWPESHWDGSSG